MSDLPIVCTLTPNDLQRRREQLLPGLVQRAEACDVLENGVRLRYAPSSEVLADIVKMIDAERQCCRFLRFEMNVAPDLGPISLEVTGPPGAAEFLAELIDDRAK